MLNRKLYTFMFFVIFSTLAVLGCQRSPEQRAERIVNHISEKLDLNEAQKAKLNAIKDEFMAKAPAMKKSREETFNEVIALMRSPKIEPEKVTALVEKNKAQADDVIGFILTKFVEFHDMLTPEQREKAAVELEKWREHHHGSH